MVLMLTFTSQFTAFTNFFGCCGKHMISRPPLNLFMYSHLMHALQ